MASALRGKAKKASLCVTYTDVGKGREQDAVALLITYLEQLNYILRALIETFLVFPVTHMKDKQTLASH